jgi:hypothetical protein
VTHLEVDRVAQRAAQWANRVGDDTVFDEYAKDVQRLLHLRCHSGHSQREAPKQWNDSIHSAVESSLTERQRRDRQDCFAALRCGRVGTLYTLPHCHESLPYDSEPQVRVAVPNPVAQVCTALLLRHWPGTHERLRWVP